MSATVNSKQAPTVGSPSKSSMESIKTKLALLSSLDYMASIISSTCTSKKHSSLKQGRRTDGQTESEREQKNNNPDDKVWRCGGILNPQLMLEQSKPRASSSNNPRGCGADMSRHEGWRDKKTDMWIKGTRGG